MSEEELVILQNIQYALDNVGSVDFEFDDIQGLLDLYQTKTEQLETALNSLKKEKEKNKELNQLKGFEMLDIFNMGKESSRQRLKHDWVEKDKIKEIIYPTPTNPISYEIQSSDMYRKILQLLEEE